MVLLYIAWTALDHRKYLLNKRRFPAEFLYLKKVSSIRPPMLIQGRPERMETNL